MTLQDLRELADILADKDEEICRSKQEWEYTFNSVPDLIAILNTNSIVTRVNKSLVDKLGIHESDIIGKRCSDLFHSSSATPLDCPHKAMIETQIRQYRTKYISRLKGWYEITLTPLFDSSGEIVGTIHILHDITELKNKETELIETNISLDAANQELRAITEELQSRLDVMESFVKEFKDKCESDFELGG